MNYSLESFIDYCDSMMINDYDHVATEGLKEVAGGIKKFITNVVKWIGDKLALIGQRIKNAFRALMGKDSDTDTSSAAQIKKLQAENAALTKALKASNDTLKKSDLTKEAIAAQNAKLSKTISILRATLKNSENSNNGSQDAVVALRKKLISAENEIQQLKNDANMNEKEASAKMAKLVDQINKIKDSIYSNSINNISKQISGKKGCQDEFGYIFKTFKAYPSCKALIPEVSKLLNMILSDKPLNENEIHNIHQKVKDAQATCKGIFKREERVSNPKFYAYTDLTGFVKSIQSDSGKIYDIRQQVRKLLDIDWVWNTDATRSYTDKDTAHNSKENINEVLNMTMQLISTIDSYSNLVFKVKGLARECRPSNQITYNKFQGDYNYGKYKNSQYNREIQKEEREKWYDRHHGK